MAFFINRTMMDDEPAAPTYGYARDLSDIESAATGTLDVTELTENAITVTGNDKTELFDDQENVSKIYNSDMVLAVVPGRHAAVKAAKDAYDAAAMKEVSDKYAENVVEPDEDEGEDDGE